MTQATLPDAIDAHQQGDFARALDLYTQLLTASPENPDILHLLGILWGQQGEPEKARNYVQAAIERNGQAATYFNTLGNIEQQLDHHDLAIQAYQQAIHLAPDSPSAHNNLGNSYRRRDQWGPATQCYQQAIALMPGYADAYFNLGGAYLAQEQLNKAQDAFHATINSEPKHFEAHRQLGRIMLQLEKPDEAIDHFLTSLEIDPDNAEAYVNLGAAYIALEKYEAAITNFAKALDFDPLHYEAHFNLGVTYLTLQKPRYAQDCFLKIIDKYPTPEVYYNLGVIYMYQDHHGEALNCLQRVLTLEPKHLGALINLGVIYIKIESYSEAIEVYQQAVALDPENTELRYTLAALEQRESPAEAPADYVTHLFDQYAPYFDEHLTKHLKYETPQVLFNQVSPYLEARSDLIIVDLGCGTGLAAAPFRPFAKTMIGIDLSEEMLNIAKDKQLYDQLINDHLANALTDIGGADVVMACDVFTYIGDLKLIFEKTHNSLNKNGLFAFSVEVSSQPIEQFQLQQTARYCHAPHYIERLASTSGFRVIQKKDSNLRHQRNKPLPGIIFILQKF